MGFNLFTMLEAPPTEERPSASRQLMHQLGCKVCPLASSQCRSPQMKPHGSKEPVIYMLGPQPDTEDDEDGLAFSPDSRGGRILRAYLPDDVDEYDLRFNNIVRTRADDGHRPTNSEIECCRKSVEDDIASTEPFAIFGFGTQVLHWVRPGARLADHRGRRFPVRIGNYVGWFYCFEDPAEIKKPIKTKWGWKVDPQRERAFKFDLRKAIRYLQYDDRPQAHTRVDAMKGVEVITRTQGGMQKVLEVLHWASQLPEVGFDYETSTLRPYRKNAVILTVGLSNGDRSYAFPLYHAEANWRPAELRMIEEAFRSFLKAPVRKCVHNMAFEMEWTGVKYGTEYIRDDNWDDSTSQAFVIDERTGNKQKQGPGSLHFLCRLYFNQPIKDLSPDIDANSKKNMGSVALATILPYNALDAKYHYYLKKAQDVEVRREGQLASYVMKLGHVRTVVLTQIKGARIDREANQKYYELYQGRVDEATDKLVRTKEYAEFTKRTNRHFNPESDPDMTIMLRDIIKTHHGRQEDGKYTADKEVLQKVRSPIIRPILDLRSATKALSTYVLPLRPDSEHNYDGFCHTILNTTVARTGRLSSEHPNIQNFPVRDPELGKVREQINPGPGRLIMKVDYGQIEARVIAMVSKDRVFVKALWERYDIHMAWAEKIAKEAPYVLKRWDDADAYPTMAKKMKALRTAVKNEWTFPLFFGARLEGVANWLEVEVRDVMGLYEEFWDTFQGVKKWQEGLRREYEQTNEVQYITGRKARGPITDNQLFNYPIQGPTCDIVLDAMARVAKRSAEDWNYQPIFQIHDDLTFDLPEKGIEDYAHNIIVDMLSVPFDFVNVPITLEVAIGPNWHDVKSEGDFSSDEFIKFHHKPDFLLAA